MDSAVHYSEPGSNQSEEYAPAPSVSFLPNPLARFFARLINAAIWVGAGLLLLFGSLAIAGGIAVSEIWPLLDNLLVGELPNAGDIITAALAERFADYRVRDVVLIVLIPVAAAALWFILRLLYLCLLVRFAGGDLGHLAMGMQVVSCRHGGRPSFGQALSRALLKQLDLLVFPWLLNGAMVLLNRHRRHSYDLIANTIVVAKGWTLLPFLEPRPEYQLIVEPQLNEGAAIPLPPSTG